jgi:hypothetical protein
MSRQGMLRLVEQPVGHAEQLLVVLGGVELVVE